jgi:hypothetical protein
MARSFKDWTQYDLEQEVGLVKQATADCVVLNDWLNVPDTVEDERIATELSIMLNDLTDYADVWNEEELKAFFIIPLLRLVNFKSTKYKVFFKRKLSAVRNGVELKGDVDAMIASGNYGCIVSPFFCLQEYKAEGRKTANDVRGQLLSEMLAAQTLNGTDSPILGCYLNGRFWFFATLIGSKYCFSNAYVADEKTGLAKIFNSLTKLKTIIENKL